MTKIQFLTQPSLQSHACIWPRIRYPCSFLVVSGSPQGLATAGLDWLLWIWPAVVQKRGKPMSCQGDSQNREGCPSLCKCCNFHYRQSSSIVLLYGVMAAKVELPGALLLCHCVMVSQGQRGTGIQGYTNNFNNEWSRKTKKIPVSLFLEFFVTLTELICYSYIRHKDFRTSP